MSGEGTTRRMQDPWAGLRRFTDARIAIGRSGASLPTEEVLAFALAHARARDAVHTTFEREPIEQGLQALGLATIRASSRVPDRATYLARPDLGRRLSQASADAIAALDPAPSDIAIVIADGLSTTAVAENAITFVSHLLPMLRKINLTLAPVAIVENGRVALGDEIGALLKARMVIMAIGERPGLSSVDSLGAYLTFGPKLGRSDAERNCISNIRPAGLKPPVAADKAFWLTREALRRGLTGVNLKEETEALIAER
ncbi:ethanolamine ammonia-lyase subunit EutC [Martelella endophytica]|uniref:Ethanolamine ammonia-lyase small subunit n=1 Tax=Martelella endophytica TaxID=1486262 RepID=A0A0D5LPP8_MAREN|nr:ethanolamine ammonia-lyase subunit EutC [Martelella endophytica]AJY45890.1 ethanolamine ammonia-lyase [Martelella endophytica]